MNALLVVNSFNYTRIFDVYCSVTGVSVLLKQYDDDDDDCRRKMTYSLTTRTWWSLARVSTTLLRIRATLLTDTAEYIRLHGLQCCRGRTSSQTTHLKVSFLLFVISYLHTSLYTQSGPRRSTLGDGRRGGLVVGRRTCDLVVAGSRPGRDAAA